jgi:hypothetical protein
MTMHTLSSDFQISITRYRRLMRAVTDPLAACLLEVVIRDLEAEAVENDRRLGESASVDGRSCSNEENRARSLKRDPI